LAEMTVSAREKFEHLEDKLHLSIALCESLRQQKRNLERDLERAQADLAAEKREKEHLNQRIEMLIEERREMKATVEEMLHSIAMLELEADSVKK